MPALTREQILDRALGREDVPLGDGYVTVRGVTRKEAARFRNSKIDPDDVVAQEALMISTAMIDPVLTLDETIAMLSTWGTDEIQAIVDMISRLSGRGEGQAKAATKSVPGRRGTRG